MLDEIMAINFHKIMQDITPEDPRISVNLVQDYTYTHVYMLTHHIDIAKNQR